MLYIIIAVAVVAFLVALCFIFSDNIKAYFKKIFSKKSKTVPQGEPLKQEKSVEQKIEEFIPLKNQYDDSVRDASLEELFAIDDEDDFMVSSETLNQSIPQRFGGTEIKTDNFDNIFRGRVRGKKLNKKPIAQQIKDLSPELKMLLMDSILKKRDDV
ncbi:MAG: hypothetical protein E7376_00570 [Clostridiales bacterium]|nr:hypothetical protein [Clostridiales bacterium]